MSLTRKWKAVFSLHIQDSFAYRAQGIVWILTDTVPAITLPLMWLAAFNSRAALRGFSKTELVAYFLCLSVCSNLINAHPWEIARDIKDGKLSIYLLRPFSYYWFTFNSNLSWRFVRTFLFVPFFGVTLLVFRQYLVWDHYNVGFDFWMCVVLAHLLSYQIAWCLGQVAFFLVEVSGVFEFYYMISAFLAGTMAPLQMLPESVRDIAKALPFSKVLWFPVQIFLGRMDHQQAVSGMISQIIWIVALAFVGHLLWSAGMKRYTAVGI